MSKNYCKVSFLPQLTFWILLWGLHYKQVVKLNDVASYLYLATYNFSLCFTGWKQEQLTSLQTTGKKNELILKSPIACINLLWLKPSAWPFFEKTKTSKLIKPRGKTVLHISCKNPQAALNFNLKISCNQIFLR